MNQLATCKTLTNPERLPPTENAALFHVWRVHFQVVQWQYLMEVELNAEEQGWKNENDLLVPTTTDLQVAPDDILNIISCKCKMVRKNPCSSQLCSCQKHGLHCVAACKHCCGKVCDNAMPETRAVPYTVDLQDAGDEEDDFQGGYDDNDLMGGIELYEEIVDFNMDYDS